MGGGFSCVAKGEIKAGDKFNVSGEVQMDAKPKNVNKKKKIEEVEKNE